MAEVIDNETRSLAYLTRTFTAIQYCHSIVVGVPRTTQFPSLSDLSRFP